ncbi:ABC transporter substrate-binding protein [Actinoplanes sp. TBRC 11911]|uniref:ABC transporter substrate-binding protein n=1 Tax=Actinoplanes sp. TBRC 11911 TaxID=2729386 RepID=UPI00289BBD35|nr:ABC transporter substrate-binding protein [Actinoplanes sp. TBRC 11911]
MRLKIGALGVGVLTVALVASGCSKTTDDSDSSGGDKAVNVQAGAISYDAADNKAPAPAVDGGQKGGNLGVFLPDGFEHLDPARAYVNVAQMADQLLVRTLTGYREDGKGNLKVIGDLATDPGTDVNKDCKVWQFKLRPGIKYEDGTPVTSKDVAYGVARSFSPDLSEGPHYIQQWLTDKGADYNADYKGPYNGGAALPPGVTTPDDQTIVFTFAKPHCDMPYAATLTTTAPVPAAQDKKTDYDRRPFSSGPYKIKSYQLGNSLVLERNTNWDANTDPLRTALPDTFTFNFTLQADAVNERLIADAPADQSFLGWQDVQPAQLAKTTTPDVKARVLEGPTQYVWYYYINTQRIKDLNVRKALNYAIDKDAVLKAIGGTPAGTPATTLLSPTVAGYQKYDAFNAPATGDAAKVKELLGSTPPPALVLAYANTPPRAAQAEAARKSLEAAGFQVTTKSIDPTNYYTEVGRKDNPYDIYLGGWGSDWPDPGTVIPPLFDGRQITPTGNQNLSYFNEQSVNTEIDRIGTLPSASDRAAAWAALDKKIMTDFAPVVPAYYDGAYTLVGSKVGNAFDSSAFGWPGLINVYVKP